MNVLGGGMGAEGTTGMGGLSVGCPRKGGVPGMQMWEQSRAGKCESARDAHRGEQGHQGARARRECAREERWKNTCIRLGVLT